MTESNLLSLAIETSKRLVPEFKAKAGLVSASPANRNIQIQVPGVQELLETIQPLPPQTCLVGLCEDGIPFLLDLAKSETGALLVTSDPDCDRLPHLQVMVESLILLNSPHEAQVAVLTSDLDRWSNFSHQPDFSSHIMGIHAWYEQGAADMISRLVTLGVDRSQGRKRGPTIFLVIDDLQGAFDTDFEMQNGLHWLLENGTPNHIRTLSSLDAPLFEKNPFWTDTCRTFLVGKINTSALAENLGYSKDLVANLIPGFEYLAYTGEAWLKYRMPALDL
jgi:hypothetical protein